MSRGGKAENTYTGKCGSKGGRHELNDLKKSGAISDAEFARLRAKLVQ
jgi:hypothetical protein